MNKIQLEQLLQLTVWKEIKGYSNYEVSISGSVRNITTKQILKPRINRDGYYRVNLYRNKKIKVHNIHQLVIMTFIPNINNKKCIDHKNNDKLDNTISNLRWASYQENNFNRSMSSKNTSSIKGVSWHKRDKKWQAYIKINNKKIHLGYFDNIEDAKLARQNKSAELYGEFQNECEK